MAFHPLKLAFVVPRWGDNMTGGAELHARWFAERLAACGHELDVYTTCAVDHSTWRNVLPVGAQREGALTVRRFLVDARDPGIFGELERAITLGFPVSRDEEVLWLRHGVSSRAMEDAIAGAAASYDLVLGIQYSWGVTHFGLAAAPGRSVLFPTLHDEPYSRTKVVRELLTSVHAVMFNTPAESRLAHRIAPDIERSAVIGIGFDEPPTGDGEGFRRRHGISGPSLLYVGRREHGKGLPLLLDYFQRFDNRHRGAVKLVVYGAGPVEPPDHPGIVAIPPDWDREREDVYASATVFVNPGVLESFSIVLMQAWLQGRPSLVHGDCDVTREACARAGGGLWFRCYAEFEETLERLLGSQSLRDAMGRSGRSFVRSEYSWPAVLGRFHDASYAWAPARTP